MCVCVCVRPADIELLEDFLISYRLIMPSRELLNLLFSVYNTFETKSLVLPKCAAILRDDRSAALGLCCVLTGVDRCVHAAPPVVAACGDTGS